MQEKEKKIAKTTRLSFYDIEDAVKRREKMLLEIWKLSHKFPRKSEEELEQELFGEKDRHYYLPADFFDSFFLFRKGWEYWFKKPPY